MLLKPAYYKDPMSIGWKIQFVLHRAAILALAGPPTLGLALHATIATAMLGAPAQRPAARALSEAPGSFMQFAG